MTPSHYSAEAIAGLYSALVTQLEERVTRSTSIRDHHRQDEGYHQSCRADLVAFPRTTEEVAITLSLCAQHGVAVTPWGAGTSLEGNALPATGGVSLDLSLMTEILSVSSEDMTATVQAGVRRMQLNHHLKHTGLFFAIDPGADATLGGMAATRASGTNAVKYGTMRANVVSCTAVLSDGAIIRTARRARKTAAGLDLTALLVGSEGTLGVITELTVRIHAVPEHSATVICEFNRLDQAVAVVVSVMQLGLDVARIEFLDDHMMRAINKYDRSGYAECFTLFVEFHGSAATVEEQLRYFNSIVSAEGGTVAAQAASNEDRSRLWKVRHNALYATRALQPGKKALITDVCVPISRLAECVSETRRDLDASFLMATIAGHVGDGNFHAFILLDPEDPKEVAEAERLHYAMARRAIALDGTCTGEHGIGLGKQRLLFEELGESVVVMRKIKDALDPKGILNPGKLYVRTD